MGDPTPSENPVSTGDRHDEQSAPNTGDTTNTQTPRDSNGEPTEAEQLAATIVIPSFERDATEARNMADTTLIQECQDDYHEARMKRAERIIADRESGNE